MELHENSIEPEKAILVCVDSGKYDTEISLDELEELALTAGAEVYGKIIQKRDRPDPATFIGSGRLEELKTAAKSNDVDLLIFDGELTPSQQKNIERETDVRVIDRTTLILDIFAARAMSNEGKIQVELAQLRYSLPRLGGKGVALSRLGAGIGTRGPGESKLESDRRHIRRRIHALEGEIEAIKQRRENLRARREKDGVETVAIVGYTNAGKSTLMNTLTQAGVLVEDKLFATLDPTSRALELPDGRKVMLIDTVGLVRRLPHHLVEAFHSTLEQAASATMILNVCDASSNECAEHLEITRDLMHSMGCEDKPIISVMNKCDLAKDIYDLPSIGTVVNISALYGDGIDELLNTISSTLPPDRKRVQMILPYKEGPIAAIIRKNGKVFSEEYRDDGLFMDAIVQARFLSTVQDYILDSKL